MMHFKCDLIKGRWDIMYTFYPWCVTQTIKLPGNQYSSANFSMCADLPSQNTHLLILFIRQNTHLLILFIRSCES